jgi:uncharacterized protein YndB with AHSA1/START domain
MAKVSSVLPFGAEEVFDTLVSPDTYPHWLIGARDIRAIDPGWPEPGSCFHHRVGLVGPLKVADSTKVVEVEPPRMLSLEVRARPFGRGLATFTLEPGVDPSGSGDPNTRLELDEVPLGALQHLAPVLDPVTRARNGRSLELLADFLGRGMSHRFPG